MQNNAHHQTPVYPNKVWGAQNSDITPFGELLFGKIILSKKGCPHYKTCANLSLYLLLWQIVTFRQAHGYIGWVMMVMVVITNMLGAREMGVSAATWTLLSIVHGIPFAYQAVLWIYTKTTRGYFLKNPPFCLDIDHCF